MKRRSTRLRQSVPGSGPLLMVLLLLCWGQLSRAAAPIITSLSATSGIPVTGSITINGTGFNDTADRNIVFFGGAQAMVTAATPTQLTVTVPAGSVYGQVSVLNLTTGLMAASTQYFTPTFDPTPYIPYSRAFKNEEQLTITGTIHSNALTYHAVTGDIDGDGKMDIIVASYDSFIYARSPIEIFRNTGTGGNVAFDAPVICTASYGARNIRLGDIDGDGKLDIVVASSGSGRISVIRNMSTPGNINMATNLNLALSTGSYETALADFDGDGKLDIAAIGFADNMVEIFRNIVTEIPAGAFTSSGTFTSYHVDFPVGNGPVSIAAADLDADGKVDIVVDNNIDNTVTILKNNSVADSFMFSNASTINVSPGPLQILASDLNNDGKPDIIVPSFNDHVITILQNQALPGLLNGTSFAAGVTYPLNTGAFGIAIGDLNGDGKMDIAASNFFADSFTVLRNQMSGSSINTTSFVYDSSYHVGTGFGPLSVTIADVDGDTKADVLTANNFNSSVSIFESYELPQAGGINGPDSICRDQVATYTSSHVAGATGYWSVANGHISVAWTPGAGDTTATVTGMSAGTDTLIYKVVYLSDTNTMMKVITVDPLADTGVITGPSQVCANGTITLSDTVAGGVWSSSDTSIAFVDSNTGVVTGRAPGNATIMYAVTSAHCGSLSASHPITVLMAPDAGTISGPTGTCVGSTITLTASATGGTWYNMYPAYASDVPGATTDVVTGQSVGADTILYIMTTPSCGNDTAWHSIGVIDGVTSLPIVGDTAVCIGQTTTLANAATGGVWLSDAPLIAFVDPITGVVTGASAGTAHITYTVTYSCGTVDTFINFTVRPNPVAGTIDDTTVCNGTPLTIHLSSNMPGSTYHWTNSDTTIGLGASGTSSTISFTAMDTATAGTTATISVTTTSGGCTSAPEFFNITVNSTARLLSTTTPRSICSNSTFNYIQVADRSGTTFSWSRAAVAGISNPAASDTGNISEVLHNTTPDSVQVTYVDTLHYNGCLTTAFISVYVKAKPTLTTTMNLPICDSSVFIFNPSSATPGATFTWTRDTVTGIANDSTGGTGGINEILNNNGTDPVMVTYTYTVTAAGCNNLQNVTVLVNPTPVLSSAVFAGTFCDSTLFNYYPTSATAGVGYSWIRDSVAGIMNAAGAGTDTISEYLYNTTDTAITVSYLYTLNIGACSDTQRVYVTINPRGMLTSTLNPPAICSGDTFNYTPTSNLSGATFSWTRNTVSGINNLPASGTGNPAEVLDNNSINFVDVPYIYTVTAMGCTYTQVVTVRVWPKPILSVTADTVCSGTPYSFTATSPVGGTAFSWTRPMVPGITPDSSSGSSNMIAETLTNSTLVPVNAIYVFTLTANGCSYTQNYTLTVNPTVTPVPVITTHTPDNVCMNTMYQNFGASVMAADTNVQYQWSAINATVWATGTSSQYAIVNFTTPGTAQVILTANVVNVNCPSADTFSVSVSNSMAPDPTVIYFNKQFVCIPADLDSYQWGYDDANYDSTLLVGEVNQDYINESPDPAKYYWVMTTKGDCMQKTYYRVPTAVVNVNADDIAMKLYPNPANAQLTIEVSNIVSGDVKVQIFNVMGQVIGEMPLQNGKASLNVSDLAQGSYLVACYRNGVKVATSRFVKN